MRDLAAVASGAGEHVLNRDASASLEQMVKHRGIAAADLTLALSAVEDARELARGNVNPQLVMSGLIRTIQRRVPPRAHLEQVR